MARHRSFDSQIYLMADAGLDPAALRQALGVGAVACVLLRTANGDDQALRAAIDALRPVAHEREVAFLVENRTRLAHETGCDGVHLTEAGATVKTARQEVGAEAIVGVQCSASRHAAMVAAEAGADYVAFGGGPAERWWQDVADPELVGWWQAIMTAPCVAMVGDDLRHAAELAAAGADFVAVGSCIWADPGGPDAAVRALLALLDGGRAAPGSRPTMDE
jgi:thiamine-phosphate pyrophosphorylase